MHRSWKQELLAAVALFILAGLIRGASLGYIGEALAAAIQIGAVIALVLGLVEAVKAAFTKNEPSKA
jgi:uncharacterized membrane protein YvlD (DUF360 family)